MHQELKSALQVLEREMMQKYEQSLQTAYRPEAAIEFWIIEARSFRKL